MRLSVSLVYTTDYATTRVGLSPIYPKVFPTRTATNIGVIEQFLPVRFVTKVLSQGVVEIAVAVR